MDPIQANLLSVAVPTILVLAGVLAVLARRGPSRATGGLTRVESWVASIIGAGAVLSALGCAFGLWSTAVWLFGAEPFRVDDLRFSGSTTPAMLEGVLHVAASGYQSVWIDVQGLPAGTRALFYAEHALPLVASLVVSIGIAWLSFTVVRGRPFSRALPIWIGITAIAILIGGLGSQMVGALARTGTIEYLGSDQLVRDDHAAEVTESFSYLWLQLDTAPIGWAFGLLLVAAAFQIGHRLQRDTEGLV